MLNRPIETPPAASIIAIVNAPIDAEPIVRWTQEEAGRLDCEAAVVFAPAFDELAGQGCMGSALRDAVGQVQAVIEKHGNRLSLVVRPESSLERVRDELLQVKARLLVAGSGAAPLLAELLFGRHGSKGPPVVLVPGAEAKPFRPHGSHRVLTVGFHDSRTAIDALQWAVMEAERTDSRVRVVVVWSEDEVGRLSGGLMVSSYRCALPGRTAARVGALALSTSGVALDRVSSAVMRGSPVAVLVREAASSDLLVVGASPIRVHNHAVLGATSAGCVASTSVPVVVVPAA